MRAITYDQYGDPDNLTLTDVPEPKVGPAEVLVRVRSAAVNPVDWKVAAGGLDPLMTTVFPAIPGWDVAGVVERVGLDTPEFEPGDEVIAYARKDFVQGGTFADYVTVPVRAVARKPRALDWDQSAGLPLAGLTAYQLLSRSAWPRVRPCSCTPPPAGWVSWPCRSPAPPAPASSAPPRRPTTRC